MYTIAPVTEADLADVHRMIIALAVYEKEDPEKTVQATPEHLRKAIFDDRIVNVFIARQGDQAVGFALYFLTYSTWLGVPGLYLEDLFVDEAHRGVGLGKRLFGELGKVAQDRGCGRVEWRVLKWNQPSIDFYIHALKAEPQSEWEGMRVEGEGIARLAAMRR